MLLAVLGVVAKDKAALVVHIIDCSRERLRERLRLDRLVQQALAIAIVQEAGDHEG